MSTKMTMFAVLVIFAIGLASVRSVSAFWTVPQRTGSRHMMVYNLSSLSTPVAGDYPINDITATPTIAQLRSARHTPTVMPLLPQKASLSNETATSAVTPIPRDSPTIRPASIPTIIATETPVPTVPPAPTFAIFPTLTLTETAIATPTAESGIKNVVIISIDGLRPDALDLAHTPNLDRLRARGAYSAQAQTVSLSITLPSHASMLSGMIPEKHGILWGLPYIGWPGMNGPTLFSVAHEAGLSTAMVFGKDKMNYLVLPNSVDTVFGGDVHDPEIRDQTLELIEAGLPNILFIHFPDTDRVGHAHGWMSENQFHAITYVDGLIGEIMAELEKGSYLDQTLLIVTSDHGGRENSHGDDSPIDRTIPWLAVGPGVRSGLILTGHINTYDTAATALYGLELPIPEHWDGRPIMEIFR